MKILDVTGGQPSLVSKFPEIVDITAEFIKQHGFAAQNRRRSETWCSSGVTTSQIRDHLYENIPGLKDHNISLSTICRLFQAPNKNFHASMRYKSYVNARVWTKSNSYREYHPDAHYLFARNKMRRELVTMFPNEMGILSINDMAKIKVGAPAVSRYHQLRAFFPTADQPNLSDHDFPVPGYLLTASGYMFLEYKSNSEQLFSATVYDQHTPTICSDFPNLSLCGVKGSIYESLSHQLFLHLNVKATATDCFETIFEDIKKHPEYLNLPFDHETLLTTLKQVTEIDNDVLNIILKSASTVFSSKIVTFYKNAENEEIHFVVIQGKKTCIEPPIYIFKHSLKEFESLSFRKELINTYNEVENLDLSILYYDNLGRAHFPTPYSGPASLKLRSTKYDPSTVVTHITDIHKLLQSHMTENERSSFMLLSDGGPDFNPSSVLNQIHFYCLFKVLKLDFMSVFTYAARYSAFNPIEHLWSIMSNKLSGVIFSPIVDGEDKSPCQQAGLSQDEVARKEAIVFNNAMKELSSYWNGINFDDYAISNEAIQCSSNEVLCNDYEKIKAFLASPLHDLHQYSDLVSEYKQMFGHIDHHLNELMFVKCNDRSCCDEWKSNQLKTFLQKYGMKLFAPVLGKGKDGHYNSFLQTCIQKTHQFGDSGQPTASHKNVGKCQHCPSYHFKSETEKNRHMGIFHRRQKTTYHERSFSCNVCSAAFSSLTSLNRHKKNSKHAAREQPPAKKQMQTTIQSSEVPSNPPKKTKQRSIHDILRTTKVAQMRYESSSDDDEEEECGAPRCLVNNADITEVKWIECDTCAVWFHACCVGMADRSEFELQEIQSYICEKCARRSEDV